MGEDLFNLIKDFGIDVKDELIVSPFEYQYMLTVRDNIAEQYALLDADAKEQLLKYDIILLRRATEFYEYLKQIKTWGDSNSPIYNWWWHLDKVVSGELNVILAQNKVIYKGISYNIIK